MSPRRDPLGEFNTAGLEKCPHCSDYKPERTIYAHMTNCTKNPANQAPAPPTEETK